MKDYQCGECGKKFTQKCNWVNHTQNKKYPCIKNNKNNKGVNERGKEEVKEELKEEVKEEIKEEVILGAKNIIKKFFCRYCLKSFTRADNLKRHINGEKCEVLRLQEKQKENIFINLLEEEKIVNQTKIDINHSIRHENPVQKSKQNDNQMDFLITQIKLLNDKLELQRKESEIHKKESEEILKLMTNRYGELEKKHNEVIKINEKLQNKVNKIVNKNKIINTSTSNTTNSNNKYNKHSYK